MSKRLDIPSPCRERDGSSPGRSARGDTGRRGSDLDQERGVEQEERRWGGDNAQPDLRRELECPRRTPEMHSRGPLKGGPAAAPGPPPRVAGGALGAAIALR